MNPTLKRKRIGDLDPWIETLIQNYGKDQNKVLKAQVTDVSEMSESQRLEEDDNCFLFVSDGIAVIPAVLSDDAWELLLE
ncbi:hypothetical protein DNTS_016072 [Danionella cerebrum]|uniref:Uncharacterized protein n=1 Tax=Danionella cerebrum TaxID=2873325 RepID=A0A553QHT8_9TELE|nr:hypothetical protein DNTS_016072 [Danionella translucida]